jgi:molybdenum cofactor sulfurtransferase
MRRRESVHVEPEISRRAGDARIDPVTAFARFFDGHPAYSATNALDKVRALEHGLLDSQGQVYLDYTGGGLYADSQVREHAQLLSEHVFGNPHSANPSSMDTTQLVERTRATVLAFFNGTDEYTAVFTLNASRALKLVGESYPFATAIDAPWCASTDRRHRRNAAEQ